jgi:hypothetical protein
MGDTRNPVAGTTADLTTQTAFICIFFTKLDGFYIDYSNDEILWVSHTDFSGVHVGYRTKKDNRR